jgi:hypothetical protein
LIPDDADDVARTQYIKYLITLYIMEVEDGFDMGVYPTYEQFLKLREEETLFH